MSSLLAFSMDFFEKKQDEFRAAPPIFWIPVYDTATCYVDTSISIFYFFALT